MIVLDASVVLAVILDEVRRYEALAVIESSDILHAPGLLPYEVVNAISVAKEDGRLTGPGASMAIAQFIQLPWAFEAHVGEVRIAAMLSLTTKHRLTGYDASYLELAMRSECPLASFDKELRAACTAEGVAVLPKKLS